MRTWRVGKMKKRTKRLLQTAIVTGMASGVAAAFVSRITLRGTVESLADSFDRIKKFTA
jgi:hypothetical protein